MPKAEFNFDAKLKSFITATKRSMELAWELAQYTFVQFEEHDNLTPAQTLFDAMGKHGKNYVRRMAYLKWLADNSPVKIEKGKLSKDKEKDAKPFNRKKAFAIKFWEANPDPEQIPFSALVVDKRVMGVIKSLKDDRHVATDDKAKKALAIAEAKAQELHKAIAAL